MNPEQPPADQSSIKPPPPQRWKPGQSGNPSGRPKGSVSITEKLRMIVGRAVTDFPAYVKIAQGLGISPEEIAVMKVGEVVAHAAILQAVRGKPQIVTEVLDRVDGPVTREIRDEGRLGVSDVLDLVAESGLSEEAMAALRDKVADASRSIRVRVDFTDR